jgi:hypothetical protein
MCIFFKVGYLGILGLLAGLSRLTENKSSILKDQAVINRR